MRARRRALVIWNDTAGSKLGLPTNEQPDEDRLRTVLADAGVDAEIRATESVEQATAVVREAAAGDRMIVSAGGDGTLRVVATALLEAPGDPVSKPPIGILPLGSVMNVARSLDIPRELAGAAAVLGTGRERAIDVGVVDGHGPFFEGVAIGLHAELFAAAADLDDGDATAPLRAIATALRYRPSRITLEPVDGPAIRTKALVVSVANGPYLGLAFTLAPGARMDDGLLDVRVFERFSRWDLLRHFWAIAAGKRRYEPRVRTIRTASLRVDAQPAMHAGADGGDVGETPTTIRVLPAAIRILVPA